MLTGRSAILLLFANLVSSVVGYRPRNYARTTGDYPSAKEYDYVIIGGGTAGLTVGDRLSEDGKSTVLVIEYGYYQPEVPYPWMYPYQMFNITSEPQKELGGAQFPVMIACAVGGSSIVNGQKVMRGTRPEYDAWKELGGPNSTWDWEGIFPYFLKAITMNPPNETIAEEFNIAYQPEYWGNTSRVQVTYPPGRPEPIMKTFYDAMANMPGMTIPEDAGMGEAGLYWYPYSQDNVTYNRSSARTGHWDGLNRPTYEMIVGAKANKVLFNGKRAIGVQYISRNDSSLPPVTVKARKQVIVSAGTIHTPQVLIQSGIGPASLLKSRNIPMIQDLPGVGSNFQDHQYIYNIQYKWGIVPNITEIPFNGTAPDPALSAPMLSALMGMPIMSSKYKALSKAYASQDPTSHLPSSYTREQIKGYKQQQKIYAKLLREPNVKWNDMMLFYPHGTFQNLHPFSRGLVLPPVNSSAEMSVDYRALSNPLDLDVMVEIFKYMRKFMLESDLRVWNISEIVPGLNVTSDADLKKWARSMIIPTVFHPIGTAAKMPREWGGVVDEELGVHGVEGLSVVDASIMPTLVGVPTQLTVYAIAEKAAEFIKMKGM